MKQTGLDHRVIEAVGLYDVMSKSKFTLSYANPLVKDDNGETESGVFSYKIILGLFLYMSGHTRTDYPLAMNSCDRYMFIPKRYHELALKILTYYLNQTNNCGLVLNLTHDVCKVDTYPDANFSRMCGHEDPTAPAFVNIHTIFINHTS